MSTSRWNETQIRMCETCECAKKMHYEGDTHEVCEAGHCVLCFQHRDGLCRDYEPDFQGNPKRGHWEQGDIYDIGDVCSECDYDSGVEPCEDPICPQCGAIMKEIEPAPPPQLIDVNQLKTTIRSFKMDSVFEDWHELSKDVQARLCQLGKRFREIIDAAPIVDATPVVRCGQCLYHESVEGGVDFCSLHASACCGYCEDGKFETQ